jgi:hypothetical protein
MSLLKVDISVSGMALRIGVVSKQTLLSYAEP